MYPTLIKISMFFSSIYIVKFLNSNLFFDRNHRYYLFYVPTYFIYQTLFLTQQTKFCILPKINKFFQSQIVERYHHNFKFYVCFKFHNSKSFTFTRSLYIQWENFQKNKNNFWDTNQIVNFVFPSQKSETQILIDDETTSIYSIY